MTFMGRAKKAVDASYNGFLQRSLLSFAATKGHLFKLFKSTKQSVKKYERTILV